MNLCRSLRPTPNEQLILVMVVVVALLVLTGCQSRHSNRLEVTPPAPVQEVKVAVPVPCQIEQVAPKSRPQASKGMNVFDLSKIALADRRVLTAENTELRAANTSPCPGAK